MTSVCFGLESITEIFELVIISLLAGGLLIIVIQGIDLCISNLEMPDQGIEMDHVI